MPLTTAQITALQAAVQRYRRAEHAVTTLTATSTTAQRDAAVRELLNAHAAVSNTRTAAAQGAGIALP